VKKTGNFPIFNPAPLWKHRCQLQKGSEDQKATKSAA
jgi:hypothetical protein